MMNHKYPLFLLCCVLIYACTPSRDSDTNPNNATNTQIFKGLYSYGPEIRTFIDCSTDINYWVVDSSDQLELSYNKFNFEKPYEPVYIEAEGHLSPIDTSITQSGFDSTIVVTKLKIISKNIPDGPCATN